MQYTKQVHDVFLQFLPKGEVREPPQLLALYCLAHTALGMLSGALHWVLAGLAVLLLLVVGLAVVLTLVGLAVVLTLWWVCRLKT